MINKKTVLIIASMVVSLVLLFLVYSALNFRKFTLTIETNPSLANVTIDDETQVSPATFTINKGEHDLIITKSGYTTINEDITVTKDKKGYYNLVTIDKKNFDSFIKTLPKRTPEYLIWSDGSNILVEIKKAPASTIQKTLESLLSEAGVDPADKRVIWTIPAYLRRS